jgi:glycine/D-amino acid oxidase-like deaminating enzyme
MSWEMGYATRSILARSAIRHTLRDYRAVSYWLDSCGDDLTPRPALDGSASVDVAILGAGFTGLWTAYYLLRRNPGLKIAVLERHIAGFGASGRNGGWCTSNFALGPAELFARFGRDAAHATQTAMFDTVDEVEHVIQEEKIDAQFRRGGELLLARGPQHLAGLRESHKAFQRIGLENYSTLLDAGETRSRVRVAGAVGSLFMPSCAALHPGRLVRGLARAVERRGAVIYEQTDVTSFDEGSAPALHTARGEVKATTIVLAGEAYLTRLPPLHRRLLPVYSLIVLSDPISDARWREIGWEGQECLASARYTVDYLSRTADGRILFGGRGAPYHFASRIDDSFDRHSKTHAMLKRMLQAWFPMLKGIGFGHAWGGPLGVPRDWLTTMSYDRARGVAMSAGYVGQGVATTNLAGRALSDLITSTDSAITRLPMVNHQSPAWEREPLRWVGARYVQIALQRIDTRAEKTGKAPTGRSLAERLAGH